MPLESRTKSVSIGEARVVACDSICRAHVRLDLALERFSPSTPGQFLQIHCQDSQAPSPREIEWNDGSVGILHDSPDWSEGTTYLRRPFSISDRWDDAKGHAHLSVISRSVGPGTTWIEHLRPGAALNLIGPLGRGFRVPSEDRPLVLIGGGVGIPPLLYLTRILHESGKRNVVMIFGATSADLLPVRLVGEAATDGIPRPCVDAGTRGRYDAVITTDDGSLGLSGLVTDAMKILRAERAFGGERPLTYACGPAKMLEAVADLTRAWDWDCQVCIERRMACGMGTCLSCVVRVNEPRHESGWRWALTCQDGPVFDRDELLE